MLRWRAEEHLPSSNPDPPARIESVTGMVWPELTIGGVSLSRSCSSPLEQLTDPGNRHRVIAIKAIRSVIEGLHGALAAWLSSDP